MFLICVKNATPVSKDQVRMMVLDIGYTETSKRLDIKRDTLYQWAKRYGWNQPIVHSQETVRTVRPPADVHADTLQEHERETRLSLARYARRAAKEAEGDEQGKGGASIRDAPLVHKVAQVAGLVHKWDSEKSNQTFTLNVLNINSLDNRLGGEESASDTIDV